jgi:hypothetical protein
MHQVQQPPPPQPPVQVQMPQVPRDKRAEFMRGHPPVFAHSADPMDAEDCLRTVAEPPELFQLKCLSPTLEARQHLNGNNTSVPWI